MEILHLLSSRVLGFMAYGLSATYKRASLNFCSFGKYVFR